MVARDFVVNFMVVGTQKGGTTALDSFLRGHPEICLASIKEPHFFDLDFFFDNESPKLGFYRMYFTHFAGEPAVGEATPTYMYAPHVARRLHAYNPALKLIVLLRHPAERAFSQYNMQRARGAEPLSFADALRAEDERLHGAEADHRPESPFWIYSYRRRSDYLPQIENLLRYFPRTQCLFVRSEQLLDRHRETLAEVHRFLGVTAEHAPPPARVFAGSYAESMPARERAALIEALEPQTATLERLLGWDLRAWRS